MRIKLIRAHNSVYVTIGMLQVEGVEHQPIFTLENPERSTTVDSRIPPGVYTCRPYSSERFPDVYEVMDVPDRSNILIHAGNFEADTTGCILLGLSAGVMSGRSAVMQSGQALALFRKIVGDREFELEII